MLRLSAIAKAFGKRKALAGVTLEVAAGEAVLLVGENGAGKTTLLRIATGFLDPDAGDVSIDGVELARERARAQARLGYLPEHAPAPPELAVRDHLRLRARLKRLGRRADEAVARAMAAADIEGVARQRIGTLSKGYRQRVGLADALLGEPPLLVLDEPTSGMDPIQTRELRDHLIGAAKQRAVLVSSHAVADLERVATRVAVLAKGELRAVGTTAELCAKTGKHSLDDAVVALMEAAAEGRSTAASAARSRNERRA
ncbi:MAG: ABC transporter ATP-binding protein [Acidobacteriota bacterium]